MNEPNIYHKEKELSKKLFKELEKKGDRIIHEGYENIHKVKLYLNNLAKKDRFKKEYEFIKKGTFETLIILVSKTVRVVEDGDLPFLEVIDLIREFKLDHKMIAESCGINLNSFRGKLYNNTFNTIEKNRLIKFINDMCFRFIREANKHKPNFDIELKYKHFIELSTKEEVYKLPESFNKFLDGEWVVPEPETNLPNFIDVSCNTDDDDEEFNFKPTKS